MVDNLGIDPKVPVLTGGSLKDFKTYQRAVQATWLSLSEEDQKRLGPKLYRNLLAAKTSVSISIEQLDPALLTGTEGPAKLLAELEMGGSRELASKRSREHTRLSMRKQCFNVVVWSRWRCI